MLRAAVAAEDAGNPAAIAQMEDDIDAPIAKLKDSLENTGVFEKHFQGLQIGQESQDETPAKAGRELSDVPDPSMSEEAEDLVDLKSQLEESRVEVQTLLADLERMSSKMNASSNEVDEESKRVEEAAEAIRQEHDAKVDDLCATHARETAELKRRLDEVMALQKDQAEQALRDIEAAKSAAAAAGDSKTEEVLEQQMKRHDRALQELETNLIQERNVAEDSSAKVVSLEAEIATLKSEMSDQLSASDNEIEKLGRAIEKLQDEIQSSHESKANEEDAKLLQIKQEHHHMMVKLATEAQNSREAHEEELKSAHAQISTTYSELTKVQATLEASQQHSEEILRKVKADNAAELRERTEDVQRAEQALASAKRIFEEDAAASQRSAAESVRPLEEKIKLFEAQATKEGSALRNALSDLEAARSQIKTLQQVLEDFEKEGLSKDEQNAGILEKAKAEASKAETALVQQTSSLESVQNLHTKVLQDLKSSHAFELESLEGELALQRETAISELQAKYDELGAVRDDLQSAHEKSMIALEEEHQSALSDSTKMIADLQEQHFAEIQETREELERRHSQRLQNVEELHSKEAREGANQRQMALDNLQSTHEKTLLDLRSELERSSIEKLSAIEKRHIAVIAELHRNIEQHKADAAQAREEARDAPPVPDPAELAAAEAELNELRKGKADFMRTSTKSAGRVKKLEAQVAQDQESIVKLTTAAQDANKLMVETIKETDLLRQQHSELAEKHREVGIAHAEELAKVQKALKDLSDRHSQELITLKDQLNGAAQEAETQRSSSDSALKELTELKATLKAKPASKQSEPEPAQAPGPAAEQSAEKPLGDVESKGQTSSTKIDELQAKLDDAQRHNAVLANSLETADAAREDSKIKIRELEASLKVTKAELTEAKTKRADGADFLKSPTVKTTGSDRAKGSPGLANSKWAATESEMARSTSVSDDIESKRLGSTIEGKVGLALSSSPRLMYRHEIVIETNPSNADG